MMQNGRSTPVTEIFGGGVRLLALAAGYAVLGLACLIAAEIVLRRAFRISLQGADELGGYVLAVLAAFGFAYTLLERGHTRIELVLERLPLGARAVLDVLSLLAIAAMAVFLAWRGAATLAESIEFRSLSGTPLMTPLWMPQAVWVAGLSIFALVALACLAHALVLLVRAPAAIQSAYGVRSLDEEIEAETARLRSPAE